MNQNAKKYFHMLKHKIPYVPKMKTAYLSAVRLSLDSYLQKTPAATMTDLTDEIGTVDDLCEAYKDELTPEQLTTSSRRNKILLLCILLITVLVAGCTISYLWYALTHLPDGITTIINFKK